MEAEKKGLQAALDARDQKLQEEVDKNACLATELEKATAEISSLKAETKAQERRAAQLEVTPEKQRAKHESTPEKQKAELEEKLQAEVDAAFKEGAQEVTTSYEAPVLKISQKVWELGWMAALKEAGVSKDHPAYKNPPNFPSPNAGSSSAPGPSSKADAAQTKTGANIGAAT